MQLFYIILILSLTAGTMAAETTDSATVKWQALYNQVWDLSKAVQYDSAITIGQQALRLALDEFGNDDTLVALTRYRIGIAQFRLGQYSDAEDHMAEALRIGQAGLPPDHRNIGSFLNGLGLTLRAQGNYAEAEQYYRLSLEFKERTLGADDPRLANSLNNLADLYVMQSKHADAEELYERVLAIRETALGPDDPAVGRILFAIASMRMETNNYLGLEKMLERSRTILVTALGEDHPEVAQAICALANYHRETGRYDQARPNYKRAIRIWTAADDPLVWTALMGLALTDHREGHYSSADSIFERTIEVIREHQGENHADLALTLGRQANLYEAMGRYNEAEELFRRALAIIREAFGSDNAKVGPVLNNLAFLLILQDRYVEAERLLTEALSICESALGADHRRTGHALESMARLYIAQRRYEEAMPYLERSVATFRKVLGPDHPSLAYQLTSMADLRRLLGDYETSESLLNEAVKIEQNSLGEMHPDLARTRASQAAVGRLTGRPQEAVTFARQAFNSRWDSFVNNNVVLDESDAIRFSQLMRHAASEYLSSYADLEQESGQVAREAARVVLSSKGQVSDAIFRRRRAWTGNTDTTIIRTISDYRQARLALANHYVSGNDGPSQVDSLAIRIKAIERSLAGLGGLHDQSADGIELDNIATALPPGGLLIEYLRYRYLDASADTSHERYLAVTCSGDGKWHTTELGEASTIDRAIHRYRSHMNTLRYPPNAIDQSDYNKIGRQLYRLIVVPLEEQIMSASTIVIAPDAGLNMVSFAGLVDNDGHYLVEKVPVHYLISGRDLARMVTNQEVKMQSLLALGDPDFDATTTDTIHPTASAFDDMTAVDTTATRFGLDRCDRTHDMKVTALPGTRKEVQSIASNWNEDHNEKALVLLGSAASEDNFRMVATEYSAIHLATHGYYVESECQPTYDDGFSKALADYPLLNSGLLLAGSNRQDRSDLLDGRNDGILTAEEVAIMNLENTRLVVLSACETGLGEVHDGEGVYGLRRAFQMAGVSTVVSALWPIPDQFTAELLGSIYDYTEDTGFASHMATVQRQALQKLRSEGRPDHPVSWAGFIALGDWR